MKLIGVRAVRAQHSVEFSAECEKMLNSGWVMVSSGMNGEASYSGTGRDPFLACAWWAIFTRCSE